ncbi:MAG: hypothetical protein LZF62_350054 [Nitrospira sp.]|nr:MAG: hypothetical protein LZF62_350054 [Nitrospira sp.]
MHDKPPPSFSADAQSQLATTPALKLQSSLYADLDRKVPLNGLPVFLRGKYPYSFTERRN